MTDPAPQAAGGRRVLIVAPAFFPHPQVAAVRVTHWARILPGFGWLPHIAMRSAGERVPPEVMASEVHPDVVTHPLAGYASGPPAPPQAGGPSMARRARALVAEALLVPDASILFWRRALGRVREIARQVRPEAVITTGPPHSIHTIGMVLQGDGYPWIADYRDPHIMDDRFLPSGVLKACRCRHERFDRRVYERADAITHAIEMQERWARLRYPGARARCVFLPHVCPTDLVEGDVAALACEGGRLSVRAIGHIGDEEALKLARAVREVVDGGADVELRLAGKPPGSGGQICALLGERAVIEGRVPHDRARSLVAGADVLVAALNPDRARTILISSKLFEYAASRRPIIIINPSRPDRLFVRRIGHARVLRSPAQAELTAALRAALADRAAGAAPGINAFLERYSAARHGKTLSGVLDRVAGARRRAPRGSPREEPV